jgi:hypothetical protein
MEWGEIAKALALMTVPFTVYLGWKKLGNKALISYSMKAGRHTAMRLSNIVITNCKDKPLIIHALYVVENKDIMVPIQEFSPPLVLKGLESCLVEGADVSEYRIGREVYEIKFDVLRDIHVLTSGGTFRCKADETPLLLSVAMKMDYRIVSARRDLYNGKVFNQRVRFGVAYRLASEEVRTAFIDQSGFIGLDWPFAVNAIPVEQMRNEQSVAGYLGELFRGVGLSVVEVRELNPCESH